MFNRTINLQLIPNELKVISPTNEIHAVHDCYYNIERESATFYNGTFNLQVPSFTKKFLLSCFDSQTIVDLYD